MTAPVPVRITDPDDARLAGYVGLTDRQVRRRSEGGAGIFVVESRLALEQLLASNFEVASVLVATNQWDWVRRLLTATAGPAPPVYVADPRVLATVAGFNVHRGVVALGRRRPDADPHQLLAAATAAGARAVVVTEGVNNHENLGAIFRNAAAFGAGAVLVDPTTCDPLYRRSIRVSLGHVLRVPFARLEPWPAALADLRADGWTTVALTPAADAEAVDDLATAELGPVAVLVGAEGPGLAAGTLEAAEHRVRIPLAAGVDSVNVATATAIVLHRLGGPRPGQRFAGNG
ncbi:MAG: RNA methyltransferase [Actinomycetota bacterium]|nr:RNA methyltransferase [Actinomycetota bacterium]